ncbi:MAG: 50S ribosomal protein L13 [Vampirovibrionales bacterium]|nr:50S ribosomal protein L13 [Vampirovibrionales bacterium]
MALTDTGKTYTATPDELTHDWILVDAEGKTLGRLATEIAIYLRGKHKPVYSPHLDHGDFVVVINADKVKVSGNKADQKEYIHHTGYLGHLKRITFKDLMVKDPTQPLTHAVWGMLAHNRLGRQLITRLKVYAGPEHPHAAQQPKLVATAS